MENESIANLAARVLQMEARFDAFQANLPALQDNASRIASRIADAQAKADALNAKLNAIPSADAVKALVTDTSALVAAVALGKCGLSAIAPALVKP